MSQWTTLESGPLARSETQGKGPNWDESREPVDHFVEWTTSWVGNPGKGAKPGWKSRASGPLWRVDHWLGQEPRERRRTR